MSTSTAEQVRTAVPYPGPRPFETGETQVFFGRDVETANVLSLVIARRTVVIASESGAGKSSLLRAGLIPALRERDIEVLPLGRVRGTTVVAGGSGNVYVRNLLRSWASTADVPGPDDGASIADYLATVPRRIGADGEQSLRVVVLDQFEELFSLYPDRWKDRKGLFLQLEEALSADPLLRVVFAMRADYLSRLQPFAHLLGDGLRCRFQLERLRQPAALEAVREPLRGTDRTFEPGVAEALVDALLQLTVEGPDGITHSVPGEFVEPVQLQIVCKGLWDRLPPDATTITQRHVDTFARVGQALARFYGDAVDTVAATTGVDEVALRSWFDNQLVTPAGTRGMVFRGHGDTGGIPNAAVDALEDLHIIRSEWRSGSRWYELSHDLFIRAVEADNRARYEAIAADLEARRAAVAGERRSRRRRAGAVIGVLVLVVTVLGGTVVHLKNQAAARARVAAARQSLVLRTTTDNSVLRQDAAGQRAVLQTAEQARIAALQALGHDGLIVFWSNRDGRGQIYEISANGRGEKRLSDGSGDDAFPAVSPDGKRIVFRRMVDNKPQLFVMGRDGSAVTQLISSGGQDTFPSWSPDGSRIAFQSDRDGPPGIYRIYTVSSDGSHVQRLTESTSDDEFPSWSPDGKEMAFQSNRDGVPHIWIVATDGSGQPRRLTADPADELDPSWSPDGRHIAFESFREPTGPTSKRLFVVNRDGSGLTAIPNDGSSDGAPAWSPDGERIAFRTNRDGTEQVFMVGSDGSNPTRVTSGPGVNRSPRWVGS